LDLIEIDGSEGEGGGQILRTSLALSLITSCPFRLFNIRARRKNPGLAPQHLKSIQAAADISASKVEGANLRSQQILFEPGEVIRSDYRFDITTAGATSLVLQTIYFPLALKAPGSRVSILGGTHVPQSPSYHYLALQWLPWMQRLGYELQLEIHRAGYYPKGGGEIEAAVGVHHKTVPALTLKERGALIELNVLSTYTNLPRTIAERQLKTAADALRKAGLTPNENMEELAGIGAGCQLVIQGKFEMGSGVYFALGERGKPAEQVGQEAAVKFLEFYEGSGAVDQYLADQLLLPGVLQRSRTEFDCSKVTRHLLTNRDIIQKFCPARIEVQGEIGQPGSVVVHFPAAG
jgi:RNA 3'-terminal phosphate cyclase (ATP)